jgi:hypothetical protein
MHLVFAANARKQPRENRAAGTDLVVRENACRGEKLDYVVRAAVPIPAKGARNLRQQRATWKCDVRL